MNSSVVNKGKKRRGRGASPLKRLGEKTLAQRYSLRVEWLRGRDTLCTTTLGNLIPLQEPEGLHLLNPPSEAY
jgi:hypothetical protein